MVAHLELDQTLSPSNSLMDFLVQQISPEAILRYEATEEEQERAEELIDRFKDGTISPNELRELRQIQAEDLLVMTLKTHALQSLNHS
jgi:Ca2+-binding EF-hand superfamily protein